jgi:hypothetical protein
MDGLNWCLVPLFVGFGGICSLLSSAENFNFGLMGVFANWIYDPFLIIQWRLFSKSDPVADILVEFSCFCFCNIIFAFSIRGACNGSTIHQNPRVGLACDLILIFSTLFILFCNIITRSGFILEKYWIYLNSKKETSYLYSAYQSIHLPIVLLSLLSLSLLTECTPFHFTFILHRSIDAML